MGFPGNPILPKSHGYLLRKGKAKTRSHSQLRMVKISVVVWTGNYRGRDNPSEKVESFKAAFETIRFIHHMVENVEETREKFALQDYLSLQS